MSKQWACNEHECGVVVTAVDLDELIVKVNQHFSEVHDSYELEEMIEDAAIDVEDA
jgi:predicted small metal-binding protein